MKRERNAKERGPVEIVEAKGSNVRIYSGLHHGKESFLLSYYAAGKRKRLRLSSLSEAKKVARKKIDELTSGSAHVENLTPRQAAVVAEASDLLREIGVPLSEAIREYTSAYKLLGVKGGVYEAAKYHSTFLKRQSELKARLFSELFDEFIAKLQSSKRSARYIQDCQSRLSRPKQVFRNRKIQDITTSDLETWLNSIGASGRNRNNYRSALCAIFSFARRQGYLPRKEMTEAELLMLDSDTGGKIGIYTPNQLLQLLSAAGDNFVALPALGGLAGLRVAEIHRLTWEDIKFSKGFIEVSAEKAKTGSRRLVPILPALKSWLYPVRKKKGPVVPTYSHDSGLLRAFWGHLKKSNVKIRLVHNGLRHGYASYRLATIKNKAEVALEMGTSPRKIDANYRELVTPQQGAAWFSQFRP